MRFSVIVPVHNTPEDLFKKALESVKNQVFTDYELIVICDNCNNDLVVIAQAFTDKIIITDYGCPGLARNAGLEISQGDYILFLDSDDWWLHEYVFGQIDEKLRQEKEPDMLCYSFIFKDWMYASPKSNNGNYFPAVWNKCWKRDFIKNLRFNNQQTGEDFEFLCKAIRKGPKIIDWDMPMYYYNYMRAGSQSDKSRRK